MILNPLRISRLSSTLGVRGKLLLTMLSLVLGLISLITYIQVNVLKHQLEEELQQRTQLLSENLNQRAMLLASNLQHQIAEHLASYNLFELTENIKLIAENSQELEYIVLIDKQRKIHIHTQHPELLQQTYPPLPTTIQAADSPFSGMLTQDKTSIIYTVPINIETQPWGSLIFSYSLQQLNQQIANTETRQQKNIAHMQLQFVGLAIIALAITYLLIFLFSKHLTAPLLQLTTFAKQLSSSNFSKDKLLLPSHYNDEIGVLSHSFAEMIERLKSSYLKLEQYNKTLEDKVEQRTIALSDKNTQLVETLKTLGERQQQLIQQEKMAALGMLVAGIAHEINTPLGAIQASVGNSERSFKEFIQHLPSLFDNLTPAEHDFFLLMLKNTVSQHTLTTREERLAKRQILRFLDEHAIPHSDEIAEMWVDMGFTDIADLQPLQPYLSSAHSFDVIKNAYRLTGISRARETIQSAVDRASKVVFALKNFAHQDNSGSKVLTNINEGLETILVLYKGQIRLGFEVIKHLSPLPDCYCYADELNQVWTNLIHNALQAMTAPGTLTLTSKMETLDDAPWVVVQIEDTGSGIREEIQDKIFDTFFTTKPAGEGSGLGLGICQRIIEKHNGTLSFESEPGHTVFTARFPLQT